MLKRQKNPQAAVVPSKQHRFLTLVPVPFWCRSGSSAPRFSPSPGRAQLGTMVQCAQPARSEPSAVSPEGEAAQLAPGCIPREGWERCWPGGYGVMGRPCPDAVRDSPSSSQRRVHREQCLGQLQLWVPALSILFCSCLETCLGGLGAAGREEAGALRASPGLAEMLT